MSFNSIDYLIFLPAVLLVYYVLPKKIRYLWLLVSSYYFYMCWNAAYALLILTSTVITYLCGLAIEKVNSGQKVKNVGARKKWIVAAGIIFNLGILIYFKYAGWGMKVISKAFAFVHIQLNLPAVDVLLPVGISFYTFQALGYMIDVYRGEIRAEKNIFRYALFVSFFPQLVAGPIERSKNLLQQLAEPKRFDFKNAEKGVLLILWGFFLKIVLADRIAVFVDCVYKDPSTYTGYYIIVASVLFAVQIYCDFAGYSTIAVGTAKLIGIELMENFDAPYLSVSVAEFWKRWHVSLSSWFKDYLYIPLGGGRRGKLRKYVNKMIVFLVSGLWHGASFNFVVWGGLNGLYQIAGEITKPFRDKAVKLLGLHRESFGHRLVQTLCTFILVDLSWVFFRADGMKQALHIIKSIFTADNPWILFDGALYNCGLNRANFLLMILCCFILFAADLFKKKRVCVADKVLVQDVWFRVLFIASAVLLLLLFGVWGGQYDAAGFIYFQF